ncbi:hypothetical protein KNO30_05360 [Taylorella equigenitalis]|uniref:hypothetical protein n=1 Tax=Taylorella equigenitalis TaxID=29575 RepID=UPI00040F77D3|nr:hypothetical protein [Taylorella equigenitalis]WDU47468.1 hypothetical protein KNO30_05360 [Taylorella equigenitalis]
MKNIRFVFLFIVALGLGACSGAIYEETDIHFTYNCQDKDGCPSKLEEFKKICATKYKGKVLDSGHRKKFVHLRCRPADSKKPEFKIFNHNKPVRKPEN